MKNKILLSWYATMNDFKWENINGKRQRLLQIEENGPTASVHASHWDDYEKHTILYNEGDPKAKIPEEDYAISLRSFLQSQFPHHAIEMRKVPINDVISIEEIASKVQPVIAELSLDRHIDIFISPGTPSMQMAWILSGLNFKDKVTLFQGRAGRFTTDGKNEKVIINLESSIFPRQLNITEAIENKETKPENAGNVPKGLQEVYALAAKVAKTDRVTCLILGPNGSGKERLARYIHDQSARRNQPYIAVNCAAFSDELLRSELFGHKKGAFTGADKDRIGILEDANGGTVFLDEIGDISPVMQVALLRVLQEKEVQPVGENKPRKIDVRIIAATNRNLKEDCKSGRFRWDLYYRLHIAPLEISPLYVQGKQTIKAWIFLKTEEFAK